MKKEIEIFISEVGREKFDRALMFASLYVRADARFVGLSKVREPIAETAALNALGGKFKCALLTRKDVAGLEIELVLTDFLTAATEHVKSQLGHI